MRRSGSHSFLPGPKRLRGWLGGVAFFLACGAVLGAPGAAMAGPTTRPAPKAALDRPSLTSTIPAIPASVKSILAGGVPKNADDVRAMERHVRKVSAALIQATVGVYASGAGSGVIVSPDGHVLTAGHVSRSPGRQVMVVLPDGRRVRAKTLGANLGVDAGMIQITDKPPKGGWPWCELGRSGELEDGQWVLVTGHPGGYRRGRTPPVRLGRVLRVTPVGILTDCTIVGGDSGGPLFDMNGRVVGINSRIGGAIDANVHVPVDAFRRDWERLAKAEAWGMGRTIGRGAYLGVTAELEAKDARIASVLPDTPAAKAGLKVGDVVLKLNNRPIRDFTALAIEIARHRPGQTVKLTVRRDKKTLTLPVTLARRGR